LKKSTSEEFILVLSFTKHKKQKNTIFYRCIADVSFKDRSTKATLSLDDAEIKKVMQNDLLLNVYRDGVWGTIKHLVCKDGEIKEIFIYVWSICLCFDPLETIIMIFYFFAAQN